MPWSCAARSLLTATGCGRACRRQERSPRSLKETAGTDFGDSLAAGAHTELVADGLHVPARGAWAHEERRGDLPVGMAGDEEIKDLLLSARERRCRRRTSFGPATCRLGDCGCRGHRAGE